MIRALLHWLLLTALFGAIGLHAAKPRANDFPTVERVQFVESCIGNYPDRPRQEMVYKCSCMLDEIAKQISYQSYVDLSTSHDAITIAGDRGAIRDYKPVQNMAKQYRELQAKAKQSCLMQ